MDPTQRFSVSGRTALVTGSSRGIGYAFARALAGAGCAVAIHGRNPYTAQNTASQLEEEFGTPVHAFSFDLTDPQAIPAGIEEVVDALGPLDVLVNNAGIQRRRPLLDVEAADWQDIMSVNVTAGFFVAQHVAGAMMQRGSGKIINIGSVQSQLARPGITPYAASKGAVVMLTRGLCAELAPHGIQVNALAPGYIESDLTRSLVENEDFSAWVRDRTPAGRWGTVDDLVGALLYLASPASDFMNGQVLYVDGGMTSVV